MTDPQQDRERLDPEMSVADQLRHIAGTLDDMAALAAREDVTVGQIREVARAQREVAGLLRVAALLSREPSRAVADGPLCPNCHEATERQWVCERCGHREYAGEPSREMLESKVAALTAMVEGRVVQRPVPLSGMVTGTVNDDGSICLQSSVNPESGIQIRRGDAEIIAELLGTPPAPEPDGDWRDALRAAQEAWADDPDPEPDEGEREGQWGGVNLLNAVVREGRGALEIEFSLTENGDVGVWWAGEIEDEPDAVGDTVDEALYRLLAARTDTEGDGCG